MDRDPILLTPGPLTTTLRTKLAMLRDWGSWDSDFNTVTARLRSQLLDIVHGHETHVVVPLQGSGTFSVEAAVATILFWLLSLWINRRTQAWRQNDG